jgi:hypothetical protein
MAFVHAVPQTDKTLPTKQMLGLKAQRAIHLFF